MHGGRRPGAGRKPKGDHGRRLSRPPLASVPPPPRAPDRCGCCPTSGTFRSARGMAVVGAALLGARARPGFRVTHVSVQGNHVDVIAEAGGEIRPPLSSGMKAFSIRLAKGMNRLMQRRGPVLEDRYHAHVLRTPAEVRRAVGYVHPEPREPRRRGAGSRWGRGTATGSGRASDRSSWRRGRRGSRGTPGQSRGDPDVVRATSRRSRRYLGASPPGARRRAKTLSLSRSLSFTSWTATIPPSSSPATQVWSRTSRPARR